VIRVICCCFLACAAALASPISAARAQNGLPRVTVSIKNADEAWADLEAVIKLGNAVEQKQLPVLKDYLDVFLIGVDRRRPLRIDLIMGAKVDRYITSVPIADFKKFKDSNLYDLGYDIKYERQTNHLYKITLKKGFSGYMRYLNGYATIAELREEVPDPPKDEKEPLPDPTNEIEPLVSKYDAAVWGRNVAEGQDNRQSRFDSDRKQLLAEMKPLKDETPSDFGIRKAMYEASLDELGRIYAEGKELILGWILDGGTRQGRWDVEMVPLSGTSLDASVKLIGAKPSRFANVARSDSSILSGRVNTEVDDVRKTYLLRIAAALRAGARADAATKTDLNESQRAKRIEISDKVIEMLEAGVNAGIADGFVEVHPNPSGKNTLLFGSQAVEGNKVVEILKLVPEAAPNQSVENNVDREGGVSIHKVVFSSERHPDFARFFGGTELYVGTKDDAVWCTAGENALPELKEAIKKVAEPPTDEARNRFLSLLVKMGPWVELRDQSAGAKRAAPPAPKSQKASGKKKGPALSDLLQPGGSPKVRKLALEAAKAGDDTFEVQLDRSGDQVVGFLHANTGILRFAGKLIADFSKENLDDK
jgi:hypothetical protein